MKFIVSRAHTGNLKEQLAKYLTPTPTLTYAGGAGYKIWEIISGDHDVYVHKHQIKKWDICAGAALLNTANGRITDLLGKDIKFDNVFDYKVEDGLVVSMYEHNHLVKALKKMLE